METKWINETKEHHLKMMHDRIVMKFTPYSIWYEDDLHGRNYVNVESQLSEGLNEIWFIDFLGRPIAMLTPEMMAEMGVRALLEKLDCDLKWENGNTPEESRTVCGD